MAGSLVAVSPAVSPPASPPGSESVGPELRRLAVQALAYADASCAPATRRAYNSAWRAFTTWCAARGQTPLPASADLVAAYLTDGAARLKVASLQLHRAAIDAAHRGADLTAPDSARLREVWDGIRRQHGAPAVKKRALRGTDIRKALRKTPAGVAGARDRALILVGFASAMRRGELAGLSLDESAVVRCSFVDEGLEITIARSKGDQFGAGATLAIPHGKNNATCPVSALRAWLDVSQICYGPVFRAVDRIGRVGNEAVSDRTVARIIKLAAQRAGLDPNVFAGHSLRRGMITDAVAGGAAPESIQAHARHARWDTTRGYIEQARKFTDSAAGKLGL